MREVLDRLESATAELVDGLRDADLDATSLLPGWSRLTIACHLRYGAHASHRMTDDSLAGRPTAYYPEGRTAQRPSPLVPVAGESSPDVVDSLAIESAQGLGPWSEVFVRHVLPMRLEWLNTRRSNHRQPDKSVEASWLLVATDMEIRQEVRVAGEAIVSRPGDTSDTVIIGTGTELLALLMGRAPSGFAPDEFGCALPGP